MSRHGWKSVMNVVLHYIFTQEKSKRNDPSSHMGKALDY